MSWINAVYGAWKNKPVQPTLIKKNTSIKKNKLPQTKKKWRFLPVTVVMMHQASVLLPYDARIPLHLPSQVFDLLPFGELHDQGRCKEGAMTMYHQPCKGPMGGGGNIWWVNKRQIVETGSQDFWVAYEHYKNTKEQNKTNMRHRPNYLLQK